MEVGKYMNLKEMKKTREEKYGDIYVNNGITLIALVITIIIIFSYDEL